jgi:stearoyl-CoA desaturase (delta-9 desaturase)
MNKHAMLVIVPFHLLAVVGLFFVDQYWPWAIAFFVLFGIIGNGVAGHRYFAHRSFQVAKWLHPVLTYLNVMSAFAPPTYWVIQHAHHHRTSDKNEDIHSPRRGLWQSWYGWLFDQPYVEFMLSNKMAVAKAVIKSRVQWVERHYYKTLFVSIAIVAVINWQVALMYFVAYAAEMFRIGAVNTVCHSWGYRNHDTSDHSKNNILVGILGMGFGWHNNHHANPSRLILTERWWEIDIEGYIAWLLSRTHQGKIQ